MAQLNSPHYPPSSRRSLQKNNALNWPIVVATSVTKATNHFSRSIATIDNTLNSTDQLPRSTPNRYQERQRTHSQNGYRHPYRHHGQRLRHCYRRGRDGHINRQCPAPAPVPKDHQAPHSTRNDRRANVALTATTKWCTFDLSTAEHTHQANFSSNIPQNAWIIDCKSTSHMTKGTRDCSLTASAPVTTEIHKSITVG